jgi:hypothetical protein
MIISVIIHEGHGSGRLEISSLQRNGEWSVGVLLRIERFVDSNLWEIGNGWKWGEQLDYSRLRSNRR